MEVKKKLQHNLTCTACISSERVEFIKFFSKGGTKKEYFVDYMWNLYEKMTESYPNHILVFLMDNLRAHTNIEIMKLM